MVEPPAKIEPQVEQRISAAHLDHFYDKEHYHTLGHVRLRDAYTKEIILTPAPSLDPNDPLLW